MILPETWKFGAVFAILAVVLGLIGWLAIARANLKAELAQARADYAMCLSANAEWAARAQTVNSAVRKMREETNARRKKAAKAQNIAAKEAAKHADYARELLAVTGRGEACHAAQSLIRNYLRDRK